MARYLTGNNMADNEKDLITGFALVPVGGYASSMLGRFSNTSKKIEVKIYENEVEVEKARDGYDYGVAKNLRVARVKLVSY